MHLRQYNGWKLYGSVHPELTGCTHEGRPVCDCAYHVVSDSGIITSHDTFEAADDDFMTVSSAPRFHVGKDSFDVFSGTSN